MVIPHPLLADRIEAMQAELGRHVIDAMYASNPFWQERFGDRGRRYAYKDAAYHLSYLASALRIGAESVLTEYARWLRTVLVTRGMCTRHLVENFRLIREAIVAHHVEDSAPAVQLLESVELSLRHVHGVAGFVDAHAPEIVAEVLSAVAQGLYAARPDAAASRARCADDLLYHLSYLADAIDVGRPELFQAYVSMIRGFLAARKVSPSELDASLDALFVALVDRATTDQRDILARYMRAPATSAVREASP